LSALSCWFSYNLLALNPSKSDAILLGTQQRNRTLSHLNSVNVAGSDITLADQR
jgi:hypothetical protein